MYRVYLMSIHEWHPHQNRYHAAGGPTPRELLGSLQKQGGWYKHREMTWNYRQYVVDLDHFHRNFMMFESTGSWRFGRTICHYWQGLIIKTGTTYNILTVSTFGPGPKKPYKRTAWLVVDQQQQENMSIISRDEKYRLILFGCFKTRFPSPNHSLCTAPCSRPEPPNATSCAHPASGASRFGFQHRPKDR